MIIYIHRKAAAFLRFELVDRNWFIERAMTREIPTPVPVHFFDMNQLFSSPAFARQKFPQRIASRGAWAFPVVLLSSISKGHQTPRVTARERRLTLCCLRQFRRLGFLSPSTTAALRDSSSSRSGM